MSWWWKELGLPEGSPAAEVNAAFRRRAKATHPDAGGSAEAFARTTEARDRCLGTHREPRGAGGRGGSPFADSFRSFAEEAARARGKHSSWWEAFFANPEGFRMPGPPPDPDWDREMMDWALSADSDSALASFPLHGGQRGLAIVARASDGRPWPSYRVVVLLGVRVVMGARTWNTRSAAMHSAEEALPILKRRPSFTDF